MTFEPTSKAMTSGRAPLVGTFSRSSFMRELYSACTKMPLVGAAVRNVGRRILPAGSRVWVQVSDGPARGLWLLLDVRFEEHFIRSDHERAVQQLLVEYLHAGDCFYDIGAHIGFFSLLAARTVGPTGTVIAIEPDPSNGRTLHANVHKNDFSHVQVIQAASWSSTGTLHFERANTASSLMEGRVSADCNQKGATIDVHGIALDDLIRHRGFAPPNLVKIDIEGGESEALTGAEFTFRRYRPVLLCEIHDAANEMFIEPWLVERGYHITWLGERGTYPIQISALAERLKEQ